jgi:uncharacterized protein with HEPN domain
MMQPKSPKWLDDVSKESTFIIDETAGIGFADYVGDGRLRRAVERSFLIIGEALQRLDRTDPPTAASISGLRKIVGFRNRLVHGYYATDHEQGWAIIHDFAPRLHVEVDALVRMAERDLADSDD